MNLDLDDRAWFDAIPVDGIGVHVVEGVCPSKVHDQWAKIFPDRECPNDPVAPPDWVDLSEQKCETCGGDPSAEDHPCSKSQRDGQHCNCSMTQDLCHWCGIEWLGDGEYNCPDCLGSGRPLVRVTVPCESCDGDGWLMGHDESVHPDARVDTNVEQVDCLDCDALGHVSIGSVTVEAVEACDNGRDFGVIVRRMS